MSNLLLTAQEVIEERNERLMSWMTEVLGLDENGRKQLRAEMVMVFRQRSDDELAEYVCKQLAAKELIKDVKDAMRLIEWLQTVAHEWLCNTSIDVRS